MELASHGDLVLLIRDDVPVLSRGPRDREEWYWVLTCAAPLALALLGPAVDPRDEREGSLRPVGQTSLGV